MNRWTKGLAQIFFLISIYTSVSWINYTVILYQM